MTCSGSMRRPSPIRAVSVLSRARFPRVRLPEFIDAAPLDYCAQVFDDGGEREDPAAYRRMLEAFTCIHPQNRAVELGSYLKLLSSLSYQVSAARKRAEAVVTSQLVSPRSLSSLGEVLV
jgi:hypothetical protein